MIKVYTAADPIDAHFVCELLKSADIEATIQDERTFANRGEMPTVYPSVWVREDDVAGARKIIDFHEQSRKNPPMSDSWNCPQCGERLGGQFTECWKCAGRVNERGIAPPVLRKPARSDSFLLVIIIPLAILLTGVIGFVAVQQIASMNTAAEHYSAGTVLYTQGQWDAAITQFDAAISLDPGMAYAYLCRAYCFSEKRDYAAALNDFNTVISHDPTLADAFTYRGIANFQMFNYDAALSDLDRAIRMKKDPIAYAWRGYAYQQRAANDKALADFAEALKLDPKCSVALEGRLLVAWDSGDFESVEAGANELIDVDPKCSGAYNYLGLVFGENGRHAEAISEFTKAINIEDDVGWHHANRAFQHAELDETEKALNDYAEALKRSPIWGYVRIQRARLFERIGEKNKAAEEYAEVLNHPIDVPEHHMDHAYALAAQGDITEALSRLQLLEGEPMNHWLNYNMARVYGRIARSENSDDETKKQCIENGIKHLQRAAQAGFINWKHAGGDIDMAELRRDPRYAEVIRVKRGSATPAEKQ